MLTDPTSTIAVSNLGWVDHGAVWRYDVRRGQPDAVVLGDASHLALRAGVDDLFAAVHHFHGDKLEITIQSFEAPGEPLGRILVPGPAHVEGDDAAWQLVPKHYVGWLNDGAVGNGGYFLVERCDNSVSLTRLDWFDGSSFDLDYRSVVAVEAVPENGELVFGVQRSSDLIIVDQQHPQAIKRRLRLPGFLGNPVPHRNPRTSDLWMVDYDTVVRVATHDWSVTAFRRVYDSGQGPRMFVGDIWIPETDTYVLVPCPGNGRVAVLDPVDLSSRAAVTVGHQPLEVAALGPDRTIVARDWKTGALLLGHLMRDPAEASSTPRATP